MFLVPYQTLTIDTPLPIPDAVSKLTAATAGKVPWFRWPDKEKIFVGSVSDAGFQIWRNNRARNSYLPLIHGRFTQSSSGTKVELTFSLHPIVIIAVGGLFAWGQFLAVSKEGSVSLVLVAMFGVLHVVLHYIGFLPEVREGCELLRRLLDEPPRAQSVPEIPIP